MDVSAASYHSQGKEISLEPAEFLVVDIAAAFDAGLEKAVMDRICVNARELRRNIMLISPDALTKDLEEILDDGGALHPVYRDPTGALVVALPEVRVEGASSEGRELIREELESQSGVDVVRDELHRLVLRPASGRGLDALKLANRLYDIAKPASVQPRFLRAVDRPDVSRDRRA